MLDFQEKWITFLGTGKPHHTGHAAASVQRAQSVQLLMLCFVMSLEVRQGTASPKINISVFQSLQACFVSPPKATFCLWSIYLKNQVEAWQSIGLNMIHTVSTFSSVGVSAWIIRYVQTPFCMALLAPCNRTIWGDLPVSTILKFKFLHFWEAFQNKEVNGTCAIN